MEYALRKKVSVFGVILVRNFPAFVLNTERYEVSLRIQSKCGKMRTRISPNRDTFYAVMLVYLEDSCSNHFMPLFTFYAFVFRRYRKRTVVWYGSKFDWFKDISSCLIKIVRNCYIAKVPKFPHIEVLIQFVSC